MDRNNERIMSSKADDKEIEALNSIRVSLNGLKTMLGMLKRDMDGISRELDSLVAHNNNWAKVFGDTTIAPPKAEKES